MSNEQKKYLPINKSTANKSVIEYESERIVFLGRSISMDEYEEACRNLEDFFNLLKSWEQGEIDES